MACLALAGGGLGPAAHAGARDLLTPVKSTCAVSLTDQRTLDVRALGPDQSAIYEFEIPGLHVLAEVAADPARTFALRRFVLDYDPSRIDRLSPYRTVLGAQPMQYDETDLRYFSHAYVAAYGLSLEFYLRLPDDPQKRTDHGPLLHVAVNGGHLYGYAAGTDVDAELNGLLRGSIHALASFVKGLATELRFHHLNRRVDRAGQFHLESGSSGSVLPPTPARRAITFGER